MTSDKTNENIEFMITEGWFSHPKMNEGKQLTDRKEI